MTDVLIERGKLSTDTQQRKLHVNMKMANCKPRRAVEQTFPHSLRTDPPSLTCYNLISDCQPPELWANKFLLFKFPSLWYFALMALAIEKNHLCYLFFFQMSGQHLWGSGGCLKNIKQLAIFQFSDIAPKPKRNQQICPWE